MPVPIPGADLQATSSRSAHYQGHQRLLDEEEEIGATPYLPTRSRSGGNLKTEENVGKYVTEDGADFEGSSGKVGERQYLDSASQPGRMAKGRRLMQLLVKNGVEARATEPVPEEVCIPFLDGSVRSLISLDPSQPLQERAELKWWSLIPQFTLWAAANTNILSFSAGVLGPNLFGLDFNSSVWVIVVFNVFSAIPVAYFATFGPLLGMRQMVQTRYSFGYYPALLPALCNCLTMLGFLAVNAILGGQTLSLASGSGMSYDVGIVVVGVISLMLSFVGLKPLHYYSMTLFPVILVLYLVIIGITGGKLHLAKEVSKEIEVSAGQILGYRMALIASLHIVSGTTIIGFTIPYASLASDFSTYLPTRTPKVPLFFSVYFGLLIPLICIPVFGAAAYLAAQAVPEWTAGAEGGVATLLYAMCGSGRAARFVMVLFAISVTGNTAPTIYSCGLSSFVVLPFLAKVPRYFMAIAVTAIYIPLAIVGADHFFVALENFLAVLAYWTAMYIPPTIIESLFIRGPASALTYPVAIWNDRSRLPVGYAAIAAMCCAVPIITAGMSQAWWVGWIARKIPVGGGDIGFEMGFVVMAIVYLPCRILEKKLTGR
ncbi:hypothetical protein QFC21_000077 [Naganishia friedmannii]|uniref:Uncharacterized protein n=1 Tax=Naganishia friedmannii TaxID=89922 RepID=A0ACC2WAT7_9TREE|nr:hypothetical protein QFC21_000077 [Naganishia friedmannii]